MGILTLSFQNCGEGFNVPTDQLTNFASSGNGPQSAVSCRPNSVPGRAPLRLLSNNEYDNIAKDILYSSKKPSSESKFIVPEVGPNGFSNTSITSAEDAPIIDEAMVDKYWAAASSLADEVIANKGQNGFYKKFANCAGVSNIPDTCYNEIVRNVGLSLWRRPVSEVGTNNEFARLKAILKAGQSFDMGFRDLVKALLISPNFLVVAWTPTNAVPAGQAYELNNFQLASRLAFFLWQSGPDDQLLNLAKNGTIASQANLENQVVRMLKDPRGKRIATLMTTEWLGVNEILDLGLSSINEATLNAMVKETQMMFEDIVVNDNSFFNALSADYSFINKTLADYYGVPFNGADPNQFYRTSMASTPRRGVMNHASFLIATAGAPDATHPVGRGKRVALKFSCYNIAPPPGELDTSLPPDLPADSTPREVLASHTSKSQCIGCHRVLNPYGLALESYDTKGLWRNNYMDIANRPVDTSGTLPTGESFRDTRDFMSTLAESSSIKSCLVRQVMAVGLGRRVASPDDLCSSSKISEFSMKPNSTFSDLITHIVTSRQFKMQTPEAL